MDYSIESLIKIFEEHTLKADEHHIISKKKYIENYPHSDLPEHLKEEYFNLPKALYTLCLKIKELQEK
jgi:hypothetical protein